ncbi:hypothetical protein [Nocardia sp. alder85J]|uniref:hypothetical protein n=1 Tax=Nocardia sp. alder85J TaxID=2862949 RepID=UPI001CD77DE4|nr:hypothetical protein [Nocardia sp. alder85J]MCX4095932.1 hypothetical protein [Nocardia sp. alder85J]
MVSVALAAVPEYLLIDPRDGVCLRLREPLLAARDWRLKADFAFGDRIDLLCCPGTPLDTSRFPAYR